MMSRAPIVLLALSMIGDGEPGWLARALARTDPDVDAAVSAYEAGDWDLALEHLDAATDRRGERPEIHYDRGLALLAKADTEAALAAFQHGVESDVPTVEASSHYELGNLAMMAEDWETAIAEYIGCLRAQPDHENAKWNLEVARLRKREQDKQEEEKQKEDEQKQDGEPKDDEQEQDGEPKDDEQKQDGEPKDDEQKQDEQKQDEQKQDEQEPGEPKPDEPKPQEPKPQEPKEEPAEPKPSEGIDAALEQLDQQDQFMLGRPGGRKRPVDKDW